MAIFGLISTLCLGFLLTCILCNIFSVDFDQLLGILFTIFAFAVSVPLGYKAAKLADMYAIPIYSGLISFNILKILCTIINLNDKYYIREILEILGLFFGIYIG